MARIYWRVYRLPKLLFNYIKCFFHRLKYVMKSLTHNHFMDNSYAADVCMEPLFWFVDNSAYAIGPFFVVAVVILTASVVFLAYWLGLPYWWNRNPVICVFLVIFGNWLLVNVSFHYYMAVTTHPGYPPQGELITEAVSICKKCISPKPPRTHHCSVCNRCILKMDHHCQNFIAWLNNCVGYRNHRYFYLYMAYMIAGVLFIIIFGAEFAYQEVWLTPELPDPVLEGHPVKLNKTGSIIMMTEAYYQSGVTTEPEPVPDEVPTIETWRRRAIIYMALINTGVLLALGGLLAWHSRLASKGETSIEANINKAETARLAERGRVYINPYNFGSRKNWRLFLGLVKGRTWFRHVLLPSAHPPIGDGLTWHTVNDDVFPDEWP